MWRDPDRWRSLRQPEGCPICLAGRPYDVLVELTASWVTAGPIAPLPGYVCVVSRSHVNEPYELSAQDAHDFWSDVLLTARAVSAVVDCVKMNYEIHGNTIPHLHLHLYPRSPGDPYEGGPVDPRLASFERAPTDLARLADAITAARDRSAPAG